MNALFRQLASRQIADALSASRELGALEHAPTRGRMREVLVQQLVRPLIPPSWEVMTGLLVDHTGCRAASQSGQEDILIYSPELLPLSLRLAETGVLPVEACVAAIEVKSTLSSAAIREAVQHSQRIAALASIYDGLKGVPDTWGGRLVRRPLYALFGLSSDLTGGPDAEWSRFCGIHAEEGLNRSVAFAVCCAGQGSAFWFGERSLLAPEKTVDADGQHSEAIAFFAFLTDYARMVVRQRMIRLPLLAMSHYLLPGGTK